MISDEETIMRVKRKYVWKCLHCDTEIHNTHKSFCTTECAMRDWIVFLASDDELKEFIKLMQEKLKEMESDV